jgi:nucleoside phosphorylase
MHEARHKLMDEINQIKSDAAKAGALQSNRIIVAAVKVADTLHQDAMKQATTILLDFIERMERPPAEVTGWARPHLENLGNSLLGCVPPNGFPADHQRIRTQYHAVFQQRLDGVLRDVEIGLVKGTGFVRAETMERKEEWISSAEAIQMLKPTMNPLIAYQSICTRAHSGLVRARTERYEVDSRVADNCEVPKEFWWAKGRDALQQNWATGDFETWIDQRQHLKAFGVFFLRADIEKMLPAGLAKVSAASAAPTAAKERRSAIILTALDIETRAVLRHLSNIREQTTRGGTVFHVGRVGQWEVAVAECGEGNVNAGAIAERGVATFQAEVALFVGVAGGVKDVALGDALVSSKVYGYERGKDTDEGFKPRPVVNLPANALEQRARAIKLSNVWKQRLNPELQHPGPKIYVGAIAAGEKVVASSAGAVAGFLREHYSDALGIEMEGHGFWRRCISTHRRRAASCAGFRICWMVRPTPTRQAHKSELPMSQVPSHSKCWPPLVRAT